MNEYSEKRDFHRMCIDGPAQYRIEGAEELNDAIVKNLSATGLMMITRREIAMGTRLLVSIVPTSKVTPPLSAIVSVLRGEALKAGDFEIACKIEQILGEGESTAEFS
jgi:hypothetical protein